MKTPATSPKLPPAPLAESSEWLPFGEVLLPWSTPLVVGLATGLAGLAGLLVGWFADLGMAIAMCIVGGAMVAARGAVVALGATLGGRLLRGTSRPVRWACGMAVVGVVPGLEVLIQSRYGVAGVHGVSYSTLLCWVALGAGRDALLGLCLGAVLMSRPGHWWPSALSGAGVLALYCVADALLGGPLAEIGLMPGGHYWGPEELAAPAVVVVAGALVGLSLRRLLVVQVDRQAGL